MRSWIPVCTLLFALAFPAGASAADWSVRGALGGGAVGNLNNASSANESLSAGFVDLWAAVDSSLIAGLDGRLTPALQYSRTDYLLYDALSTQVLQGQLDYSYRFGDLTASVGLVGGYRFVGERARSAWAGGAHASVRYQINDAWRVRAGYDWKQCIAQEAVYSSASHRVRAGPEVTLPRGVRLGMAYALSRTSALYYETVDSGQTGQGQQKKSGSTSAFGFDQVVLRDEVFVHDFTAYAFLPLERWLGLRVYGHHSVTAGESGGFSNTLGLATLELRF